LERATTTWVSNRFYHDSGFGHRPPGTGHNVKPVELPRVFYDANV
jgi:hypothetical protein